MASRPIIIEAAPGIIVLPILGPIRSDPFPIGFTPTGLFCPSPPFNLKPSLAGLFLNLELLVRKYLSLIHEFAFVIFAGGIGFFGEVI